MSKEVDLEFPEIPEVSELKQLKDLGTHLVSLTVVVDGSQQWDRVFSQLSELAVNMGSIYPAVNVSSHLYEPDTD